MKPRPTASPAMPAAGSTSETTGARTTAPTTAGDWDAVSGRLASRGHYLDAFLAELKVDAHLTLIGQWVTDVPTPLLKTDLFEESNALDALLWRIPAHGGTRIGMDLSPRIAGRAASNSPLQSIVCVAADARRLPFVTGTFAFILSTSTLDHFADLTDLHRSLVELRRVLQPGGKLIITLANRSNVGDPLRRLVIRLGLVPYFVGGSYRARELRTELAAAGFEVDAETAIVHHPRMMGAGFAAVARVLPWPPLVRGMHRLLLAMQRFQGTRWQYATGCFVATLAVNPVKAP